MPFTFEVDVPRKTVNGIPYCEHLHDYLMVCQGQERLYVQHGRIYRNGAEELAPDEAPGWFWDQYRLTVPATRKLVGLLLPEDHQAEVQVSIASLLQNFHTLPAEVQEAVRAQLIEKPLVRPVEAPKSFSETSDMSLPLDGLKIDPEAPQPKTWTCYSCGKDVELRLKGLHLARLSRLGKCK